MRDDENNLIFERYIKENQEPVDDLDFLLKKMINNRVLIVHCCGTIFDREIDIYTGTLDSYVDDKLNDLKEYRIDRASMDQEYDEEDLECYEPDVYLDSSEYYLYVIYDEGTRHLYIPDESPLFNQGLLPLDDWSEEYKDILLNYESYLPMFRFNH